MHALTCIYVMLRYIALCYYPITITCIVGMFDEYLARQDELGSVADTNAKLQYQAAMALKSKPKVLVCVPVTPQQSALAG